MSKLLFLIKFLKYLFVSKTKYRVHSPFVYDLVTNVLNDKSHRQEYTKIRNLSDILIYPKLTELNLSGIENLELSPRLIWCQKLKKIIVSPNIEDQDILKSLITRGVIINYDSQEN